MKCWGLWHGGHSYSPPEIPKDLEKFDSISDAEQALYHREKEFDSYYPCVSNSEMHLFLSDPTDERDPYPDRVISFGKRGGILTQKC